MSVSAVNRPPNAWIELVRMRLSRQRSFRVAQLAELDHVAVETSADQRRRGKDEVQTALRVAAEAALRDVDAALRRLDDGTYGWCTGCGGRLPRRRLDAVPSASLCEDCHRRAAPSPITVAAWRRSS